MKVVGRKPQDRAWIEHTRVWNSKRSKLKKLANGLESEGYDTRLWWNHINRSWVLYRSRKRRKSK